MATVQSIENVFECFQCGARKTQLIQGENKGADYQSGAEAFDDGWRPIAAILGSRQGILVFRCGDCVVPQTPTWCAIGERRHELEPYKGPERWWEAQRPAAD